MLGRSLLAARHTTICRTHGPPESSVETAGVLFAAPGPDVGITSMVRNR